MQVSVPAIALSALAFAFTAPHARASALDLSPVFAGTLVSTYPDGRQAHMWIARDGSYHAANRRQKPSSGRWKVSNERMCFKQKRPFPAPFSYCTKLPASLDQAWQDKAVTGEPITIRLQAGGRQ